MNCKNQQSTNLLLYGVLLENLGEKAVKEYAEIANYKKDGFIHKMQKLDEKSFTNFIFEVIIF